MQGLNSKRLLKKILAWNSELKIYMLWETFLVSIFVIEIPGSYLCSSVSLIVGPFTTVPREFFNLGAYVRIWCFSRTLQQHWLTVGQSTNNGIAIKIFAQKVRANRGEAFWTPLLRTSWTTLIKPSEIDGRVAMGD